MKKVIILFALMLTGCVEAKEEIVCNPTIEYVVVIEYVEVDNIIIETEYIEKLVKVPYETIKEVIVEVPVEVIIYETITKTKTKTEYVYVETIIEVPIVEYVESIVYVEKNQIGFVGDSLTARFDIPEVEANTIFNFGVSGKTTSYVLSILDSILEYNLDAIYLMIGINDIGFQNEYDTIIQNYDDIVLKIKTEKPDVDLYLQSILPAADRKTYDDREIVPRVNEYISSIAFTNSGVTYIDLYSLYVNEDGTMIDEYTIDGVHLTRLGYSVWIEELKDYGIEFK
jgi:lysophospholipase L1-like esterase